MHNVKLSFTKYTTANAKPKTSLRRCFLFYILIDKEPDYPYYSGNDGAHLVVVIYTNNPWDIVGVQSYNELLFGVVVIHRSFNLYCS